MSGGENNSYSVSVRNKIIKQKCLVLKLNRSKDKQ